MYYNIKIKSNGSEFSLESENKEVTQREMDLYFSCIFDVSDEFKSKIKKIELNNNNVISINAIEKDNEEKITSTPKTTTQKEISIQTVKTNSKEIETASQIVLQNEIKPAIEEIKLVENSNQNNTPVYLNQIFNKTNFDDTIQTQKIKNTLPEVTISNIKEESGAQNEIDELISLAQKQLDSFDISSNTPTQEIKDINTKTEVAFEPQKLKQCIQTETPSYSPTINNLSESLNINTPNTTEQTIDIINEDKAPQISLAEVENSLQINYDNIANVYATPSENIIEPANSILQEPTINSQNENKPSQNMGSQLDFNTFLAGFKCDDLTKIFLICAFYIKNILRQDSFTMKFINSKLFQATGKIADTSIVDELTNKEYIKVIESPEFKKYTITPNGEGYFMSSFQG